MTDKWDISRKDDFNQASVGKTPVEKDNTPKKFKDDAHNAPAKGPVPPGGHAQPAPSPVKDQKAADKTTAQDRMKAARKDAQDKSLTKTFNGKAR